MKQPFKDIKADDEITVNKSFIWGDMQWHVPAVYACEKGLVVDYCVEIDPEKIKSFFEKWESVAEHEECLTLEELIMH